MIWLHYISKTAGEAIIRKLVKIIFRGSCRTLSLTVSPEDSEGVRRPRDETDRAEQAGSLRPEFIHILRLEARAIAQI